MSTSKIYRVEEAVILCGGLGTRLGGVVGHRPKPMVEVHGRPFLEWLLLSLARRDGIKHVILATGYLADVIERHFGYQSWCGMSLTYSHEATPLGTGGALRLAESLSSSPHLLVLNGDTYCHYDSRRLSDTHIKNGAAATIWLCKARDPSRFGAVVVDAEGRIKALREKATSDGQQLVSAGVYLLRREVIAMIPPARAVSLELDVFPLLAGSGLWGVEGTGSFVDIGTPESLIMAGDALKDELDGLDCD